MTCISKFLTNPLFNIQLFLLQVNPSTADRVTQQIQSKFGDYSLILPYLEESKRLIGISTSPPPPPAPQSRHHSPVSSRLQPPSSSSTSSSQEFKKPHQGSGGSSRPLNSSGSSSSYGKPTYDGGRGGYPQQVKHPSHGRPPNGVLPSSKGPPPSVSSPSNGRVHGSSRSVPPRLPIDQVRKTFF